MDLQLVRRCLRMLSASSTCSRVRIGGMIAQGAGVERANLGGLESLDICSGSGALRSAHFLPGGYSKKYQ